LPDVIQQLEWLCEAGYENSFNFYPTHAFWNRNRHATPRCHRSSLS
jgi:hypothetical protein